MAIFRLQISSIGRSAGRTATAAAAYRAGERIRDERTGTLHNYQRRRDVLHSEIVLPGHLPRQGMEWARDRARLWNAAERAESRASARVAREFQVCLPHELSPARRLSLARAFSQELADRYGVAIDLAVHAPREGGDPRNFHAHLLATTRAITPDGLSVKAGMDMAVSSRLEAGIADLASEYRSVRERWATLTNVALEADHVVARVDHRSLRAQGIDREPLPRIPIGALQVERRGEHSELAERLRANYRARVAERAALATGKAHAHDDVGRSRSIGRPPHEPGVEATSASGHIQHSVPTGALAPTPGAQFRDEGRADPGGAGERFGSEPASAVDAVARRAAQAWAAYRAAMKAADSRERDSTDPERTADGPAAAKVRDEDFTL